MAYYVKHRHLIVKCQSLIRIYRVSTRHHGGYYISVFSKYVFQMMGSWPLITVKLKFS